MNDDVDNVCIEMAMSDDDDQNANNTICSRF